MARKRPSVQKRQREMQKREREREKSAKAAEKRERRQNRENQDEVILDEQSTTPDDPDDLAGALVE